MLRNNISFHTGTLSTKNCSPTLSTPDIRTGKLQYSLLWKNLKFYISYRQSEPWMGPTCFKIAILELKNWVKIPNVCQPSSPSLEQKAYKWQQLYIHIVVLDFVVYAHVPSISVIVEDSCVEVTYHLIPSNIQKLFWQMEIAIQRCEG